MKRVLALAAIFVLIHVAACGGGGGIIIPPGNQSPNAVIQASATSGDAPLAVNFSAANSTDPDGVITQVAWDLDTNGSFETNNGTSAAAQTFNAAGSYTISVVVTDNGGATDTASIVITVTTPGGGGAILTIQEIRAAAPPEENFVDRSGAGDTPAVFWLKNFYKPLPTPFDADRVYQNASLAAWADEILRLTNIERANNGLPALIRDNHLEMVIQAHCRDMATRDYFDHLTLEGVDPFQRLDAMQPPFMNAQGENIAANQQSPQDVVTGWMNSPGHRANILNGNFTYMGVGVYFDATPDDGGTDPIRQYEVFYGQFFGTFGADPNTHDWLEIAEAP